MLAGTLKIMQRLNKFCVESRFSHGHFVLQLFTVFRFVVIVKRSTFVFSRNVFHIFYVSLQSFP